MSTGRVIIRFGSTTALPLTPTIMSSFVSSLLAIALASTAYSSPLSTSSHYAPLQRSPLAVAPLFESEHGHGAINNSYIVVLKDDLPPSLMDNHLNFLATAHQADPLVDALSGVQQVYTSHIRGYSGRFTDGVVELLRNMPEVDFIERDQIVRTTEIKVSNVATQKSAPWVSLSLDPMTTCLNSLVYRVLHASATDLG